VTGPSAAPYATGGGGVRLEHRYAATILAAMLAGDPISELGDDAAIDVVRLQASEVSVVDDIVVDGRTASGEPRRASIGVRRNPALTTSDEQSMPLVRAYLTIVTDHWTDVVAGRWRLVLAVGVSGPGVRDTAELVRLARATDTATDFAAAIARPGATNGGVRGRLTHLTALVTAASAGFPALEALGPDELMWRWLHALRVRQLRLEGADEADRTAAVASLRHVAADHSLATADAAFAALAEVAGQWTSAGAKVTQAMARRAVAGFPLGGSTEYARAWELLDGLGRRLREGTRPDLHAEGVSLELPRDDERSRLVVAARDASAAGAAVVVTGEPDVGKSALTLRAAEELRTAGAAVTALSLRDLPERVVDVERLLGAPVPDVLAASATAPVRLLVIDGTEAVLQGRRDVLRELAAAAARVGVGVVAVTRTDGAARVADVLREAAASTGAPVPVEHAVARLTAPERQTLVDTFRTLTRVGADARVEWLGGRPGLVDVLLQAGTLVDSADLLSEADVFAAVWNGLIRNHEERARRGDAGGPRRGRGRDGTTRASPARPAAARRRGRLIAVRRSAPCACEPGAGHRRRVRHRPTPRFRGVPPVPRRRVGAARRR